MELIAVKIEKPEAINFILGQSHFIKTVEDLHVEGDGDIAWRKDFLRTIGCKL